MTTNFDETLYVAEACTEEGLEIVTSNSIHKQKFFVNENLFSLVSSKCPDFGPVYKMSEFLSVYEMSGFLSSI